MADDSEKKQLDQLNDDGENTGSNIIENEEHLTIKESNTNLENANTDDVSENEKNERNFDKTETNNKAAELSFHSDEDLDLNSFMLNSNASRELPKDARYKFTNEQQYVDYRETSKMMTYLIGE